MVDSAANLRRFVIVKRDEGSVMSEKQKTTKVALRLPTEAKQGIMDGLGQVLDKLTAIAGMVGEAEADDAATVPADLGMALTQCADLIKGLADQYAPAAPAEGEQAPPPPDAAAPAEAAAPPPPDMGKAASLAEKNLPPPRTDGSSMDPMNDSLSMQPKLAAIAGELMKVFGDEIVEAAKAGRKIAGSRYKKLSDLHVTLGTLLNELAYDEANEKAEEKAAKAPARKGDEPVAKSSPDGKIDELLALAKSNQQRLEASEAEIRRINRTPDTPRGRQVEGGGAPPSTFQWPADMSAALAKRKAAR